MSPVGRRRRVEKAGRGRGRWRPRPSNYGVAGPPQKAPDHRLNCADRCARRGKNILLPPEHEPRDQCRLLLQGRDGVAVGVEGDRHGGMPEALGDDLADTPAPAVLGPPARIWHCSASRQLWRRLPANGMWPLPMSSCRRPGACRQRPERWRRGGPDCVESEVRRFTDMVSPASCPLAAARVTPAASVISVRLT